MVCATVLLIFAPNFFRRKFARQGCGTYERNRWNNYFLIIILIYLNEHRNFYSRTQQPLKFILIYNFEFKFETFYFYLRARSLWSMLGVDFYFPWLFYFIFGARPSWSRLQVQLNLMISFHYSARRLRGVYLCLIMVSSPTSAKIAHAALWDLGAWRAPKVIAMWNIFTNSKWI